MPVTKPLVDFALYDPAIKNDSTPTVSNIQDFAKVEDLEIASDAQLFASYEPDFWVLNGTYKLLPTDDTNVHVGWISTEQSEADTDFATAPVLTINFSVVHDTDGLTLIFSEIINEWADSITVAFYNSSFTLIRTDNYTPTAYEFYTNQAVSAFKRIIITFNSWNTAFRFLRLQSVDYGKLLHFTNEQIQVCRVVEEIDPLCITLPVSTMELTLFSTEADFDITDPTGDYFLLQYRQPLNVYVSVDDNKVFIGTFYLNTWENPSETQIRFLCVDFIGLMERISYYGDFYHPTLNLATNKDADEALNDLGTAAGFTYAADASLGIASVDMYGWIPITNAREALQSICFAMGAYATCVRSGIIQIHASVLASSLATFDYTYTNSEIGIKPNLILLPLVTGVEITAHNYALRDARNYTTGYDLMLYDQDVVVGFVTIENPAPIRLYDQSGSGSLNPTTATITIGTSTIRKNYGIWHVTVAGHFRLDGMSYNDNTKLHSEYTAGLPDGTIPNVIRVSDETLVADYSASTVLALVYDYYQQRYQIKAKFFAPPFTVGDSILMDTQNSKQLAGIVERMEIDLANGFVATATIRGVIYTP